MWLGDTYEHQLVQLKPDGFKLNEEPPVKGESTLPEVIARLQREKFGMSRVLGEPLLKSSRG